MLADVIGSFLDHLTEREFDGPFIALLHALGYWDVHLLHGSFEFGKDVIAKRSEQDGPDSQFVFQTKAGDIGLSDWNRLRGQLDMLRTSSLAHPGFDAMLTRRPVLVLTGRLVGGAAVEAQNHAQYLQSRGEAPIEVWDRERLVEWIRSDPEVGLTGNAEGELLSVLGGIDEGHCTAWQLEAFSRRWLQHPASIWGRALEAGIIANRLRRKDRLDLACYVPLCLLRAVWATAHGSVPPNPIAITASDVARMLFAEHALALQRLCTDEALEPKNMIVGHEMPTAFVTYPVRCVRTVEILGLLGLLGQPDSETAAEVAAYTKQFIQRNPGTSHPVSDRWAVSLIPPCLLLARTGHGAVVESLLTDVVRWICDRYQHGAGLAASHASVDDEIAFLFSAAVPNVTVPQRSDSFLATVVLDLAALLGLGHLYEVARNDFLAVGVMPTVLEADDDVGQYLVDGPGLRRELNVPYEERWRPVDRWKLAPHHHREIPRYLDRINRPWDQLAVSAVVRDRHFLSTCQQWVAVPGHQS